MWLIKNVGLGYNEGMNIKPGWFGWHDGENIYWTAPEWDFDKEIWPENDDDERFFVPAMKGFL